MLLVTLLLRRSQRLHGIDKGLDNGFETREFSRGLDTQVLDGSNVRGAAAVARHPSSIRHLTALLHTWPLRKELAAKPHAREHGVSR